MESQLSDRPLLPRWAPYTAVAAAAFVLVAVATPPGAAAAVVVQSFLVYYSGVFALVALSISVMTGLLATERLLLKVHHRVLAQALHRASSVLAVTFLTAHLLVQTLGGQVRPDQIVVPRAEPIGFGALAFDLLLVILVTGLLRRRFALGGRPWLWRALHALAYVAWPVAITHGLTAGRAPAVWVEWGYTICLAGVALSLLTRLLVTVRPRGSRTVPEPRYASAEERAVARSGVQQGAEVPR
ncbi:hypothetical protein DPM19_21720 [Actinomadura craniellae]|uniref:Ferric reductase n=1 Tax=Actinomadura craniellae TaxID=2231787 RepID=A0A365H1Y0_9ACTN|nr:hypothetical protein [Actinomadura craniellae]RAY13114.1 hypothetical protein DPM19_21720 [Actinomadura craniellae]